LDVVCVSPEVVAASFPLSIFLLTNSLASSSVNFPVFTSSLIKLFSVDVASSAVDASEVDVASSAVDASEVDVASSAVDASEVDVASSAVDASEVDVASVLVSVSVSVVVVVAKVPLVGTLLFEEYLVLK
jgi:hypothetical protein